MCPSPGCTMTFGDKQALAGHFVTHKEELKVIVEEPKIVSGLILSVERVSSPDLKLKIDAWLGKSNTTGFLFLVTGDAFGWSKLVRLIFVKAHPILYSFPTDYTKYGNKDNLNNKLRANRVKVRLVHLPRM